MSRIIVSSLFIIIFFLCLSLHTYNARHLGVFMVMDDNNAYHKNHLFSTKVLGSVRQLKEDKTISVDKEGSSGDGILFHESHAVGPKVDPDSSPLREMKQNRELSATTVPIKKPLVSVPGRVPRKNLDESRGLFSDYSRPRTRPPSHN
ncbi:hypothetical protein DITRI_Ditri04bG0004300 [Diplodiscus trichospermus]